MVVGLEAIADAQIARLLARKHLFRTRPKGDLWDKEEAQDKGAVKGGAVDGGPLHTSKRDTQLLPVFGGTPATAKELKSDASSITVSELKLDDMVKVEP